MFIQNVLATRYATTDIKRIYSDIGKIQAERDLWISVMRGQKQLGMDIPEEDIRKFEAAKNNIDFERIRQLEKELRHEPNNKIQAFIEVANAGEYLHLGMTSRDLTDNVEQMQILKASKIIFGKYISILRHLIDKTEKYRNIMLVARTHHQPAQPTLLGRRFSMWAEELIEHLEPFKEFTDKYPLRGIKGPIGTQADMKTLLGSSEKVQELEESIAKELGFNRTLNSTGQIYPRSLDYKLVSNLALLTASPENFAITMRLMAGDELVTEGFKKGQVGSSAMPHKMNTRTSERICGLAELVKMYNDGASRISGNQWGEGDVSDSVVRRVIIPDSIFASDGLCESTLTVLNEMGAYPTMISKELDRYLPFLATTQILAEAVKKGLGREEAYAAIRKHAKAVALEMREKGLERNTLAERLGNELLFKEKGITQEEIYEMLQDNQRFLGEANSQIDKVIDKANYWIGRYSEQASYEPREIL